MNIFKLPQLAAAVAMALLLAPALSAMAESSSPGKQADALFDPLIKADQPKFEIFPKSPAEFFWKVVDAQVTFVKDDKGKVTKAIHHQGGQTLEAPKLE